jgi:hypothetical protein
MLAFLDRMAQSGWFVELTLLTSTIRRASRRRVRWSQR